MHVAAVTHGCLHLLLTLCLTAGLSAGSFYRITTIAHEGFSETRERSDGTQFHWGFFPDLVAEMAKRSNFSYSLSYPAENDKVGEVGTSAYQSSIAQLLRNQTDLIAAPLTITAQRESKLDFSHEILDTGLSLVARAPEGESPFPRSAAFFLRPFSAGVWATAVVIWIFTSFLIFLNDKFNPRETPKKLANLSGISAVVNGALITDSREFSLLGSFFYTISTACFQGYLKAPRSVAGRILSATWWVFAGIFCATYIGGFFCSLIASRGMTNRVYPYMTFHDFYNQNHESMGELWPIWVKGSSTDNLILKSRSSMLSMLNVAHAAARKLNPVIDNVRSIEDVVRLVQSDRRYLGVLEATSADYHSLKSNCKMVVVGDLLTDRSYGFAFRDFRHDIREQFNQLILEMREEGLVEELYAKHFGGRYQTSAVCNFISSSNVRQEVSVAAEELARVFRESLPVTMSTFIGPLVLYIIGIVITAVGVGVDVVIYTRIERYKQSGPPFQNLHEPSEPAFGTLTFSDEQNLTENT